MAAIDSYHFGSVLLTTSGVGLSSLASDTAGIQALATAQATGGVKFLVAANQEGGEIQQLTGPGFATMPSELLQGQLPLATLRGDAQVWGSALKSAGVNLDLAPVMDVVPQSNAASNAPIGQLDREFGYDPVTNGTHGAAYIQGMAQAGVAATAKHFPGLGRVKGNTDFTSGVTDTVTTVNAPDLGSFQSAINAGVPFVMVALALYTQIDPTHFAVFSPVVIQQMLRQRMGFTGVIMTDDIGEAQQVLSIPPGQRATDFLNAGGDLITSQVIPPGRDDGDRRARRRERQPVLPGRGRGRRDEGARRQAGPRTVALLATGGILLATAAIALLATGGTLSCCWQQAAMPC